MQQQQQQSHPLQLLLYDDPHSEYCAKVKVVLQCKRLTWTALPAKPCSGSGQSSEESEHFAARAPLGKIPALVVVSVAPGGEVTLCESEVINEWLEEQWPQPPMLPVCPLQRAHARFLSRFHDLYLEPALRLLYRQVSPATRDDVDVAAGAAAFLERLRQLEGLLRCAVDGGDADGAVGAATTPPQQVQCVLYAAGTPFLSLADAAMPGLLLYAEKLWPALGLGALSYEGLGLRRLAALRAALWAHEAVAAVLAELEPAAQAWVDGKQQQSPA